MGAAPRCLQTSTPTALFSQFQCSRAKRPLSLFLALHGLGLSPVAIESICPLVPYVPCGVYDTTIVSMCLAKVRYPSGL